MSPEEQVIRGIESLLHRLKTINEELLLSYPADDLRIAFVGLPGNVLHSNLIHMAMAVYTVTHIAWWQEAYKKEEPSKSDLEALRNLDAMTRHATCVFIFSRIEWNFRKLITFLFPGECRNGSAPFKIIYDYLFNTLGMRHYIPLYDIIRKARNSVHSNGVFISTKEANETIIWKGLSYNCIHMQPIDFMSYEIQLSLYSDLIDSLVDLLAIPTIRDPVYIEDKIH